MALNTITYNDKSNYQTSSLANEYKVSDDDMNEIKSVVNGAVSQLENTITRSTSEHIVGYDTDSKPIYEKTFYFGAMPNATNKDIAHNISNLGTTISLSGMAVRSGDSRALTIPDSSPGSEISCGVTNTNISITTQTDRSSFNNSHITIRYKKTTD